MRIGYNARTWNLAAGRSFERLDFWKPHVTALRFLQPGYGQWRDFWHDPVKDIEILRQALDMGIECLWVLADAQSFVPGTPHLTEAAHTQIRNDVRRLPSEVKFELVNYDAYAMNPLTVLGNSVDVLLANMGDALWKRVAVRCGGFYYDWRPGDARLKRVNSAVKVVSEFGVSMLDGIPDNLELRLGHLIGRMKHFGIRTAYLHELTTAGYQYSDSAWTQLSEVADFMISESPGAHEFSLWTRFAAEGQLPRLQSLLSGLSKIGVWENL